ncbi:titin homolog isoform X2 [Scylla paramamosain]|uniref:titin homolog isoform X2 n=1 Tax=Scylla paramamosain TaxID=85552 RepID=UPI0030837EA2
MATNREVLLRKLTGLLKRITDADDDYTVTADQRAALMELESLTWNYPTPQQARGCTSSLSHGTSDVTDESDDDDDDESYYVDLVPYDMTERLKEVNRALIEDPTPAECDRTITIRFREVIADYHSPRDDFPSDSDDGYGDSSDILYDAEDDDGGEGITSLTSEIKAVLGGNFNVVDQTASFIEENESLNIAPEGHAKLLDVPKLQLNGQQDDIHAFADENLPELVETSYVPDEKHFPMNASCQEFPVRGIKSPENEESLPEESYDTKTEDKEQVVEQIDVVNEGSVSVVEVSEKVHLEKEPRSFGDIKAHEETTTISPVSLFPADNCSDALDSISFNPPPKSDLDFASFDYSDDFEDFQEESEDTGKEKSQMEELILLSSPNKECPPKIMPDPLSEPIFTTETVAIMEGLSSSQNTQKPASLRSKREPVFHKVQSPSIERKKKKSIELTKPISSDTVRTKTKHTGASTPVIKPALLSSDKLNTIKNNESGRHRNRISTSSSSASSSSLSSASSSASSSSSSSASSYSISRARGRSRTSISGPVRPTAHRSSDNAGKRSNIDSSSGGGSPARPPTSGPHNSLAVASSGPARGNRLSPPARVRKAASASDLHKMTEEVDDRRQQNDKVFQAWLRQKNKQAAQNKKQQQKPTGKRTAAEIAERRAQAEEAFQVWLSRKRDQLRLEKKLRGERRRLEDQSRYARTKNECEVAYKEWCRRKREEVRTTTRSGGAVPRSQSLERPWMQEKTRKLYSAYLNNR